MNFLEVYKQVSKAGDVLTLRGEDKTFMKGFNSCLYLFRKAIREIPQLNFVFENNRLLKQIELQEKRHQKQIVDLQIQLDEEAHRYAQLEKQKTQVITKTIEKKVKVISPDNDEVIVLEYGFKKPIKINTKASSDIVYTILSQVINGKIKTSKDFYNEKILKRELLSTLNKAGYKSQIIN